MPPRTTGPHQQDKPRYSEGREALLEAAVRVFAAHGVGALTYRSVAREARVTHGLVSYHFGSREALIHAALARVATNSIEDSALLPESGAAEDFARRLPTMTDDDPGGAIAQFDLAVQSLRDQSLRPEVRELYTAYIEGCRQAMARVGVEPDSATARLVFAAVDGLILQQLIFEQPEDTEASLAVLRTFIAGLAA